MGVDGKPLLDIELIEIYEKGLDYFLENTKRRESLRTESMRKKTSLAKEEKKATSILRRR